MAQPEKYIDKSRGRGRGRSRGRGRERERGDYYKELADTIMGLARAGGQEGKIISRLQAHRFWSL